MKKVVEEKPQRQETGSNREPGGYFSWHPWHQASFREKAKEDVVKPYLKDETAREWGIPGYASRRHDPEGRQEHKPQEQEKNAYNKVSSQGLIL